MDYTRGGWEDTDCPQTKVEHALAGGAVGGLIGLIFGPLGTLTCTAVGAAIGYATSWRVRRPNARRQAATGKVAFEAQAVDVSARR